MFRNNEKKIINLESTEGFFAKKKLSFDLEFFEVLSKQTRPGSSYGLLPVSLCLAPLSSFSSPAPGFVVESYETPFPTVTEVLRWCAPAWLVYKTKLALIPNHGPK